MCMLDFGVTHEIKDNNSKALMYLYKSMSSQKDEDYITFFSCALDNVEKYDFTKLICFHQANVNPIFTTKSSKGKTPELIKVAFKTAHHFGLIYNAHIFNIMLQILMLHQNMDKAQGNKSIFLEAFRYMMMSGYYTSQLGYKIKTLKETMEKQGYE